MYFVLQTPSLQHLALVKIIPQLWTQRDIFAEIALLRGQYIRIETNKWKAIEEKVQSKVSALPLPEQCRKQLLNLIEPLGMEIIAWCRYHSETMIDFHFLDTLLPLQLCWTMHGSIDYKKTAEVMVKIERLAIERRYEIACINCLENEAAELFHSMGEIHKQEYVKRVRQIKSFFGHHPLIVFFTCTLISDVDHLHKYFQNVMFRDHWSLNKILFELMLRRGNRATCEYLFDKLDKREKVQVLEETKMLSFRHESSSTIWFYLSLLNAEQQNRVFRECTRDVLLCLLRWPLQSLFLEAAECGWRLMDNYARTKILRAIVVKIVHGFRDYDYVQLFWECWGLTPGECIKQHVLCNYRLLGDLLLTKREEFIKLVVKEGCLQFIDNVSKDDKFYNYRKVLMDASAVSNAALKECKETAVLISSKDQDNVEKRLRSEHVSRLVDCVMGSRIDDSE